MSDIFISHVEEDASVAIQIGDGLQSAGYSSWLYERDSLPGPAYLLQMGEAIDESQAMVLVISPDSVKSNQVTTEVVRAHESNKPFVPLLHGISHLEFQERQPLWRQAIGASTSISIDKDDISGLVERIARGLDALGVQPNHVPPPVAEVGEAPQSTTLRQSRPRGIQGERRIITVLFCDVTGSTAFAEQLDPEEWAEIMNEAFEYMIQPVSKYAGTVARLMGDGILAFFGAPAAHEDDPQRAILAGLDILYGIQDFRRQLSDQYGQEFNVRVGVNTGPVVVGDVGSELAGEYTAMGNAVNLAARMEQTAKPGTVQISEDTRQLVAPLFDLESLGEIEIKGQSQPVASYRVLRRSAAPGRLRGIEGLSAPLIGRSAEFDALQSLLIQARKGRGGIASIIGEAGLGKSRLLEELRSEWGSEPSWVVSRGVSYDASRPYALFLQRILQVFEVEDREPPHVIREKIARAPDHFPAELHAVLAGAIETMFAVKDDTNALGLQGKAVKGRVYDACHQMWEAAASDTPTIMVIDDLQWSDEASTDLLIDLLPLVERVPLLVLCAFRPERQSPAWRFKQVAEADYPDRYTEVTLRPLSDGDTNDLLDSLLDIADLPEHERQIILEKTDGNPFFVEEMIRGLIDSGAVVRDANSGIWRAVEKIELIAVPDSLQGLIISRVDRLDDDARRAIQVASVLGRSFQASVLESIWDSDAPIETQLNTLQRAGLITETARVPEREYAFKHELTRDAVYASVLRRRCRQIHGMVGSAIETLFSGRIEEHAHSLAYHFSEAKDDERALKYSTMAGDYAAGMNANHEAAAHYSRAIEIANTLDTPPPQLTSLHASKRAALTGTATLEELKEDRPGF